MPVLQKEQAEPIWTPRTGWIIGVDSRGRPVVDFEGNTVGPRIARRLVHLVPQMLRAVIDQRRPVVLRFEDGDALLPIIVAVDEPQALPPEQKPEVLERTASRGSGQDEGAFRLIEGKDELVLQCGKASITLRRNGKVIIKGTYVETHSEGVNRIKGGSVQFN
ncbi:hypothetical protein D7V93_21385 [Corallococcus llansteffanensis]|uniref:DUF6484 domain-containing protein n=1 Tax=Corallococcus llansteffanensis TaxID=2316731 RepID=A0A3A8PL65_9BACT|nr:hypothetical protein D7V93_21385 [Corallococcus llansteffanensis]